MISLLSDFANKLPGPLAAAVGFFLFMHVREDKKARADLVDQKYMDLFRDDTKDRLHRIETKLDKMNGN